MTPRTLAHRIAKAASETKALDIVVLNLRNVASFADFFVICSGASDRQVQAIVDAIFYELKEQGRRPMGREGEESGRWMLIDYGDVVAHVFHQHEREFYHLERLWCDAPRVEFKGITTNGHHGPR